MKPLFSMTGPLSTCRRYVCLIFGTYALVCLFVFLIQNQLLYHPEKWAREEGIARAEKYQAREWKDSTGEFAGWMVGPENPQKTVIIFHGNAATAVVRNYLSHPFRENPLAASWQVLLFEYPGFGHRPGAPDEKTIVEKALLAVDSLPGPLILVGESLGTGVTAHVAAKRAQRVEGILLITPFNNMQTTAAFHYPYLPIPLILREHYPSDELLKEFHGKVAMMIAEQDEVIPSWMGNLLFDSLPNAKRKWMISGAHHEGISHDPHTPWWQEAIQFLSQAS